MPVKTLFGRKDKFLHLSHIAHLFVTMKITREEPMKYNVGLQIYGTNPA